MKLSILSIALAVACSTATPLRVIVVSSSTSPLDANIEPAVARIHAAPAVFPNVVPMQHKGPCPFGGKGKKEMSLMESLRVAFGFQHHEHGHPSGDEHHKHHAHPPKEHVDVKQTDVHSLPFIGVPMAGNERPHHEHEHEHHGHRHGKWHGKGFRHGHGQEQPSFLMRVHFALMSLGPWEGRAVAFVLGCGIGVLLRMFFVLTLITYRSLTSSSTNNVQAQDFYFYTETDHEGAEEIFVAPPTYTYPVEKVAVPVEVEVESK